MKKFCQAFLKAEKSIGYVKAKQQACDRSTYLCIPKAQIKKYDSGSLEDELLSYPYEIFEKSDWLFTLTALCPVFVLSLYSRECG